MDWKNFIEEIFEEMFPVLTKYNVENNKKMLIICKEKRYVMIKYCGAEYKVKCHINDEFDWEIGFGLALSRLYEKTEDYKFAKKYFTNDNGELDYKEYAKWCIYENYPDLSDYVKLKEKVKEINGNGKVDL